MRSIWLRRLNNLLCVKSIVTIVLTLSLIHISYIIKENGQNINREKHS